MTTTTATSEQKNFGSPDETRTFEHGLRRAGRHRRHPDRAAHAAARLALVRPRQADRRHRPLRGPALPVPRPGHPARSRWPTAPSSTPTRATSPPSPRATTPGSSATSRSWSSTGGVPRTTRRTECQPRRRWPGNASPRGQRLLPHRPHGATRHNDAVADRLGIRLLGEFRIDGVELDALRSRQARTLLKRMGLERGGTVVGGQPGRGGLAAPAADPARPGPARTGEPGPDGGGRRTASCAGTPATRCSPTGGTSTSWPTWPGRPADGRTPATPSGARTAAEAALALVRGPLLADEPDAEWATEAGRRRRLRWPRYAGWRPRRALATGQVGDAAAYATEALRGDPYDEAALRTLMRAHAAAGRPASALAEFARVRELLAEELGIDPAPETRALHEAAAPRGAGARRRWSRGLDRRSAWSVGSRRELRILDAELERSRAGRGPSLVSGEPGVGKTALLDRWAARRSGARRCRAPRPGRGGRARPAAGPRRAGRPARRRGT